MFVFSVQKKFNRAHKRTKIVPHKQQISQARDCKFLVVLNSWRYVLIVVTPIQPINGRVVFSPENLHPSTIDRLNFFRVITLPKTGNRKKSCSPLLSAQLYGKIGLAGATIIGSFCGATRPSHPTSNKEQNRQSVTAQVDN